MRYAYAVVLCAVGLAALTGISHATAGTGLPDLVVPDCLGVNIHFTGTQDKHVDLIAQAGFKFIRMDILWGRIEKEKGVYDFEEYDQLIDSLAARGIRPLFILCYWNPLYDGGVSPHTEEGRQAFGAFVKAAALRYKGRGVLWEFWNEPNLSRFWKPEVSPENYVALGKAVYSALKAVDPDCTVLAPALGGRDYRFLETVFKLGLLDYMDVLSVHPYGCPIPEDAAEFYARLRVMLAQHLPEGKTMRIVSGEWGYPSVTTTTVEKQAAYLARTFLVNMMNDIPLSIWYDWINDGPDPEEGEHNFGTLYQDMTPKPGYHAVTTLTTQLRGCRFAARLHSDRERDYLALFARSGRYVLAAWTTDTPHTVRIPVDFDRGKLTSLVGIQSQVQAQDGFIDLELSQAVQYVEPVGNSRRWAVEAGWEFAAAAGFENGKLIPTVSSRHESDSAYTAHLDITCAGENVLSKQLQVEPGQPVCARTSDERLWLGDRPIVIEAVLRVDGLANPLVRAVELDTSLCPTAQVLPPSNDRLFVAVDRGGSSGDRPFDGSVTITDANGISLASDTAAFEVPAGDSQRVIVGFEMTQPMEPEFSLGLTLRDAKGVELLRSSPRTYSVVESFDDGLIGEEVTKYRVELDGDPTIRASVKLSYADAPEHGPGCLCARLDYETEEGWRFARVSARPRIPVLGSSESIRIWVYGDNCDGLARLRFTDSTGQCFQQDFGRINFSGWRCLEAKLTDKGAGHWGGAEDGTAHYPIELDTLFLMDSSKQGHTSAVCLGPAMICGR